MPCRWSLTHQQQSKQTSWGWHEGLMLSGPYAHCWAPWSSIRICRRTPDIVTLYHYTTVSGGSVRSGQTYPWINAQTSLSSLDPLSDQILVQQVGVLWLKYAGSSQREEGIDCINWSLYLSGMNPKEYLWDTVFWSIRRCRVAPQTELSNVALRSDECSKCSLIF